MPTNDYLPVATAGGANVDSQSNFAGSGYQTEGFQVGIAEPFQANKIWRQSSMVAAAITGFIVNVLAISILDDGNLANLITNFTNALTSFVSGAASPSVIAVAFSATPAFVCNGKQVCNFEITLTGNVTAPIFSGAVPGQIVNFIIHQDGTGSHTFAWPSAVPGGTIDPTASSTNTQGFLVDGASVLHPLAPLTVS